MRRFILSLLVLAVAGAACSDPCSLVVGCSNSPRVAVEGRVLWEWGTAVSGATMTLLVERPSGVDSAQAITGSNGVFTVEVPGDTSFSAVRLRVSAVEGWGYTMDLDCKAVHQSGDA